MYGHGTPLAREKKKQNRGRVCKKTHDNIGVGASSSMSTHENNPWCDVSES